ncbi:uncharacterized protein LOC125674870 isoform X2 [Ostrea edulis]|uniref:uncharacterized protein LOC125674870 isoform X2 n=1 Tax=Ostrea edulis TaxID=37623 RepID=UPI002094F7B4|nr:uncharacterized protein LOC125674870 isoform X2 [Ostrea edulis]
MNGLRSISLVFWMQVFFTSGIPVAYDESMAVRERQPVSLDNNVMSCSRNMECGWLVCIWAQESNGGYGCQFFHNHCNCPSDLECSGTHMSEPTESHLVWDYRCQEPTTNRK